MEFVCEAGLILKKYAHLNLEDEHGADTPDRFLRMLAEITRCAPSSDTDDLDMHIEYCIKWKDFPAESNDLVLVARIPFVSVCNHHVLPFTGTADIAYIPREDGRMAGLSKFGRVVQHFARQLQTQERLTRQISEFLDSRLEPEGLAVVLRAEHTCMTIRGLQAPGTLTTTSSMMGAFADHARTAKAEFLSIINGSAR
jgi:GTP cyclohydrolase I